MYPAVMKNEAFPIGPPKSVSRSKIVTPITRATGIFWKGFISCRILPPRDLKIPVISMKTNGKLLFALCPSTFPREKNIYEIFSECAKDQCQEKTVEVQAALERGYTVTKVFDVS